MRFCVGSKLARLLSPSAFAIRAFVLSQTKVSFLILAIEVILWSANLKQSSGISPPPPVLTWFGSVGLLPVPQHQKTSMKGTRYRTVEAVQAEAARTLKKILEQDFQDCFRKWKKRWKKYIEYLCVGLDKNYVFKKKIIVELYFQTSYILFRKITVYLFFCFVRELSWCQNVSHRNIHGKLNSQLYQRLLLLFFTAKRYAILLTLNSSRQTN